MLSMKMLGFSIVLAVLVLIIGLLLSKKDESDRELQSPFECGCSMSVENRMQFSLHFYLVALVFIIFDVELILLFPFFLNYGSGVTISTCFFISLLIVLTYGLISEWNQLSLEWMK